MTQPSQAAGLPESACTPLRVIHGTQIVDKNGCFFASTRISHAALSGLRESEDHAALIVQSINRAPQFDALVKALEEARRDLLALMPRSDTGSIRSGNIMQSVRRIETALSNLRASS